MDEQNARAYDKWSAIRETISNIKYKDWKISVFAKGDEAYLQIHFDAPDADSGRLMKQSCRKWKLSTHMTPTEVVRTAWKAVLAAEEHEAEETFRFKGQAVYSPHFDVLALVELGEEKRHEVRK